MSFDLIEIKRPTKRDGKPASVCLSSVKGGSPRLFISFTKEFCEDNGLKATDAFNLLVGKDGHKGKARLQRAADGLVRPRSLPKRGSMTFNCGHVPRFGLMPEKSEFCIAEKIEPGLYEIILPKWAGEAED